MKESDQVVETIERNARLSGAAPELLAALQEIDKWSDRYVLMPTPLVLLAKAAIRKAVG